MSSAQRTTQEQAIYDSLVYPGGDVLRNKLGITSQAALDRAEADAVAVNEPTRPVFKKFTLAEMQAVHKHLLGDVYDWAGEIRTYTTGRSAASFARPEYIESYFETAVSKPLQREGYLKDADRDRFAERSAHFANETNAVHPFIDGNGRITRLMVKDLAAQAGYTLDIERLEANKGAWYEAMKEGFERGNTSKLKQEILNALDSHEKPLRKKFAKTPAPRHDLNKNQAVLHDEATKAMTANLQELKKNPALAERPAADLETLAYWRGILREDNKSQPGAAQDAALVRFDKMAEDPQFVKKLNQETQATMDDKTIDQVEQAQKQHKHDAHEHSL